MDYHVLAIARRKDRLLSLQERLGDSLLTPLVLDVTDHAALTTQLAAHSLLTHGVDLLVNNAGLALGIEPAHQTKWEEWQTMINTNVAALADVTQLVLPKLIQRKGLVINLSSTASTYPYSGSNVYRATKAFVRQFSLNLRADLAQLGVRVTSIEPSTCSGTEFSNIRFRGDDAKANKVYENIDNLTSQEVAEMVAWVVGLLPHINVNRLEVMPVAQSFAGFTFSHTTDQESDPSL